MGISGLLPHVKSVRETVNISTFKHETILVDASIYLRTYLHSGDGSLETIVKRLGEQSELLMKNNITPVYVFDGSGYGEIKIVGAKRKKIQQGNQAKLDTLRKDVEKMTTQGIINDDINPDGVPKLPIDDNDLEVISLKNKIQSLEIASRSLTKEIIIECKKMLDEKGVKHLQATGEADTLISWLFSHPELIAPLIPSAVLSADGDMLTYGCPILITDYSFNSMVIYRLDKILNHLTMTQEMFIDFCILCGCDYSSKITGIAIIGANKLIVKHITIEAILAHINANEKLKLRHTYPDEFIEQYQIARNMFLLHSPDGEPRELYL